ncbi:hypothetical protein, partial [Streptococcus dysgalactiae]|uniref:hypothetical protein n=1 Tax=Streptococcus dysgalactiae TaxID=1334 RepID=UPI001951CABC
MYAQALSQDLLLDQFYDRLILHKKRQFLLQQVYCQSIGGHLPVLFCAPVAIYSLSGKSGRLFIEGHYIGTRPNYLGTRRHSLLIDSPPYCIDPPKEVKRKKTTAHVSVSAQECGLESLPVKYSD